MGLAAALLYLSSRNTKDDGITQLATAAGVTEVTIRNRMKELMKEENVNSFFISRWFSNTRTKVDVDAIWKNVFNILMQHVYYEY
jgi:hypothetical protein